MLVRDNLDTHNPAAFCEAIEPAPAQRFARHRTPTHGGWLNLAEMEQSARARQCLDRRRPPKRRRA